MVATLLLIQDAFSKFAIDLIILRRKNIASQLRLRVYFLQNVVLYNFRVWRSMREVHEMEKLYIALKR